MFHAARALLFRDGIIEKSHYCVAAYIEEKYVRSGLVERERITLMDAFRQDRHGVMYSLDFLAITGDEARMAIDNGEKMLRAIRKIIGK